MNKKKTTSEHIEWSLDGITASNLHMRNEKNEGRKESSRRVERVNGLGSVWKTIFWGAFGWWLLRGDEGVSDRVCKEGIDKSWLAPLGFVRILVPEWIVRAASPAVLSIRTPRSHGNWISSSSAATRSTSSYGIKNAVNIQHVPSKEKKS